MEEAHEALQVFLLCRLGRTREPFVHDAEAVSCSYNIGLVVDSDFRWVGPNKVCATSASFAIALSERRPTKNPKALVRALVDTRFGSNTPNDSTIRIVANASPLEIIGIKYRHHRLSKFHICLATL